MPVDPTYVEAFKDTYGVTHTELGNSAADCDLVLAQEEKSSDLSPS